MTVTTNRVSLSRRYRISMMAENETQIQETVTLPASLPNNPATVELWYNAYVPKGHLVVDIEPVEDIEEPEVTGFGDSLDFVGEEPAEESEEDADRSFVSYEPIGEEPDEGFSISESGEESEEDKDGGTFAAGVEDSPKEGG